MKSSILKIAGPTLALGLVFAPIANAGSQEATQKTEISVKTEAVTKLTAKEKEAIKKIASITKNITKVEASVNKLSTATTKFYSKAEHTSAFVKEEANFYASTSGKLKANTNQLKALKKQLDKVEKKYLATDAVVAANKKISDLNNAISVASKNLTDLHTQFKATVKAEESKKLLTSITNSLSKVEVSLSELSKATGDFYAKATTDSTVTVKVEADFYTSTSGSLLTNTKQLLELKKQLDVFVKNYGQSNDVMALYSKITAQNKAIVLTVDALTNFHTNFKPVQPTTSTP